MLYRRTVGRPVEEGTPEGPVCEECYLTVKETMPAAKLPQDLDDICNKSRQAPPYKKMLIDANTRRKALLARPFIFVVVA